MQFAVLVYETAAELAKRNDAAHGGGYWAAYKAYGDALVKAGVAAGGAALQPPSTGTTVRLRSGDRQVQDGPYAETKEQLGGFYLIEVPDLDRALEWGARCPAASTGSVEVRPLLPMPAAP